MGPVQIAPTRLPGHGAETLFGRDVVLDQLDSALCEPEIHVVSIVAWGGVGKTALMVEWMNRLSGKGWLGVERVFDWSFYSQGTREIGTANADNFLREALIFFGDPEIANSNQPAERKGARLAALVAERPTLLVLDGLEPLQAPKGGRLRDSGLRAVLLGLARANRGLCVVTTRERVDDLKSGLGSVTPEWELERLSEDDGARLLHQLGVQRSGAKQIDETDPELKAASREAGGHALTLRLLGTYLAEAHGGDVRRRDRIDWDKADQASKRDEKDTYGHAFKVMGVYETWLGGGGERERRQLGLLRLMGFFDRLATPGCLGALVGGEPIRGVAEELRDLGEEDWNIVVSGLAKLGLIKTAEYEAKRVKGYGEEMAKKRTAAMARGRNWPLGEPEDFEPPSLATGNWRPGTSLDAHPLVREYFAERLRVGHPDAWREGHRRLYEYLKGCAPYWPEGLEGLEPLYQAVMHGCQAGSYQDACEKVYRDRILRGTMEFYSTKRLGALAADLGAVAWFFEQPWNRLAQSLAEDAHAWLLNEVALHLWALGRLSEAIEPMRVSGEMDVQRERWEGASISYSNLSDLELALGDVGGAVRDAEQSVMFADCSGNAFQQMAGRTTHADALHQAGESGQAMVRFREAEQMQVKGQPQYPLLYSLQGFQYCDLLLSEAERAAWERCFDPKSKDCNPQLAEACHAVAQRAAQTLKWAEENRLSLLDIAHDHLTLGWAGLYRALVDGSQIRDFRFDEDWKFEIEEAVNGLRAAGRMDHLPRGLLTRAWLRFLEGDATGATADLDEAWEIAERGGMKLHMADVHLYRVRLFHAVRPYPWDKGENDKPRGPKDDLAAARALIESCGYGRRKEELEDAEAAARGWE